MEKYHIPPLVKKILWSRGYKTEKSIFDFLYSGISSLSDPFSIPYMKEACEILKKSILRKEKIFVYGDGDTDGVCASFILLNLLETIGAQYSFRLTHRLDDEYEIEENLIEEIAENRYSLLISVDCGISSYNALEKAKDYGIKVIVLDHHIGDISKLVDSHMYINPWMKKRWPEGTENLSGAGIVYKFVEGVSILIPGVKDGRLSDFIELVALSIIADSLPLTGENRILIKEGLHRIPFTLIKGISYLIEKQNIKYPLHIKDVAMRIVPQINAPGRFGKPEIALNLLMEKNIRNIKGIVEEIERMDKQRYKMTKKLINRIEKDRLNNGFIISEDIPAGLCSIIASRLTGKNHRPFLVGNVSNGFVKGSIRAPEGYNLHKILFKPLRKYMISVGGHRGAMGFKCYERNIPQIKEFWENIKWESEDKNNHYDCILDITDIKPVLIEEIFKYLEPFGKGNPEPVFLCKDVCFKKVSTKRSENNRSLWLKKDDAIYKAEIDGSNDSIPLENKKTDILYTPYIYKHNNLYRIVLKIRKIYSR